MALLTPFPQAPAAGETLEVSPGVFWLRMPLPFQLDHINLWLLRDGEGWTLIDTGFAGDDTRAAWESILGRLAGPIHRLVVTTSIRTTWASPPGCWKRPAPSSG